MKASNDDIIATASRDHRLGEPLSRHTSFRIGGPADLMVFPGSEAELGTLLRRIGRARPVLVLGNGTNLLVSDEGFRGVVINMTKGFRGIKRSGGVIDVEAGYGLPRLVEFCLAHGLSGLEWAVGIPGSVGGALVMNAGAYGGQMSDTVVAVRGVMPTGRKRRLGAAAIRFSYRHAEYPDGFVITGCTLRMKPGRARQMAKTMNELMAKRRLNQPLSLPSAGCMFKNPPNDSARRLIGVAGLKGTRVGGAQVSSKHANFIVNRGGATARDVLALARLVQAAVSKQLGIRLVPEVKLIDQR